MNSKYLRKENEEDLDYAMRLIDIKKEERPDDLDWGDIVELLGLDLNKDSLRKSQDTIFGGIAVYKKMKDKELISKPSDYQQEVQIQLQELKKERIRLSDERAALNRRLRNEARKESMHDLITECAQSLKTEYNKIKLNHFDGYFDYNLGNNIINDILPKETYNKDKWKYICKELLK